MTLYGDYLASPHRRMHKWYHYFAAYEPHFERFRNQHVTIFEIGVGEGGSLQQWRRYFGPFAVIVGININPLARQVEEDQIHVRIGSQTDLAFLGQVLAEFGHPDIVIDDGSHQQVDIGATFDYLFPAVAKNGVYLVEDLHSAYWPLEGGGLRKPGSFIELKRAWKSGDGVVVEVGEYRAKQHLMTGEAALYRHDWAAPPAPAAPPPAVPDPAPTPTPTQATPVAQAVLDQITQLQQRIALLENGETPPAAPLAARAPLQARIQALEAELAAVRLSTSWRLTGPLRALARWLRR